MRKYANNFKISVFYVNQVQVHLLIHYSIMLSCSIMKDVSDILAAVTLHSQVQLIKGSWRHSRRYKINIVKSFITIWTLSIHVIYGGMSHSFSAMLLLFNCWLYMVNAFFFHRRKLWEISSFYSCWSFSTPVFSWFKTYGLMNHLFL